MGHIGIPTSLQMAAGICTVPTARAVATGKVNCYKCIPGSLTLLNPQLYRDDRPGVVLTPGM